jgi:hypothetical protein
MARSQPQNMHRTCSSSDSSFEIVTASFSPSNSFSLAIFVLDASFQNTLDIP